MTPDEIARNHFGLALRIARTTAARFGVPYLTDDAESEALYWLGVAAVEYDASRGMGVTGYVMTRVSQRVFDWVRMQTREGRSRNVPHPITHQLDAIPLGMSEAADAESSEGWDHLLHGLSERERAAVTLVYRDGNQQRDAAALMGVGRTVVYLDIKRALPWLRYKLAIEGHTA